ncbi:probable methyltransferase PMT23 [Selaginella moellendorffii]|nr:probable methyltransferase PMT23 [Selaginella moellendorffii]|eukprot:XP_002986762.2 probable methyltransferase PMT23 [Selaginella moellendorffii]
MAKQQRADRRSPVVPAAICIGVSFALVAAWMLLAPATPQRVATHRSGPPLLNKVAVSGAKIDTQVFEDSRIDGDSEASDPESRGSDREAEEAAHSDGDAELTVENKEIDGNLATQAEESQEEKEENQRLDSGSLEIPHYDWKLCSSAAGSDYIPCLDNVRAIKSLKSTKHYEHRERHCPLDEGSRLCLVPLPDGYRPRIPWPRSRSEIWYYNVPHTGLVSYKADQQWVMRKDDVLVFPGGGTQFKKGATRYIEFVEKTLPAIAWGTHTRVVLDVGCGVASFGGYLFDKDVLTMSFAPKDEHEAQVQFALERGIPAISAVMGTTRLPFPSNVYDAVHCARCRVPWHVEGAKLLLELNRVLRPGGYFIWSATPVYQHEPEDVQIWKETTSAASKMCWKRLARTKDPLTGIGVAVFQKPWDDTCYRQRSASEPPICEKEDSPDAAWYNPLGGCMHEIGKARVDWPDAWPGRLEATPKSLHGPSAEEFASETEHWKGVVRNSYEKNVGIDWDGIRNVMDMRAGYGGFAAALATLPVWVMNVVPANGEDTLPIVFDRGLFGIYHDWCESFSTYPRTYDLLHADGLFSQLGTSCNASHVLLEMDRILRPEGWALIRDKPEVLKELEPIVKSLHWEVKVLSSSRKSSQEVEDQEEQQQFVAAQKKMWRPEASI